MNKSLKSIQANFSRAAVNYLNYACMQKDVAQRLINLIPHYYNDGLILDLGSGPSTFAHINNSFNYPTLALDLSRAMLSQNQHALKINADANFLPLATQSMPLIISNLMLQWATNLSQILNEIHRVLTSNGCIILTTLIKPSLDELNRAWHEVDNHQHSLAFLHQEQYTELFKQAKFNIIKQTSWSHTNYFTDLYALCQHFKLTGTSLSKANNRQGLGGITDFKHLTQAYEKQRTTSGLPLSYHYLLTVLTKTE